MIRRMVSIIAVVAVLYSNLAQADKSMLSSAENTRQVLATNPQPLAAPNLDLHELGTAEALLKWPDGSVLVGGDFSSVAGISGYVGFAKLLP
jgi:hypothetical protein